MTIDDVIELARERAEEERTLAIRYETDGFPSAAMPHDIACAVMERFARTIDILNQVEGFMDV